jgi:hypothetical protein
MTQIKKLKKLKKQIKKASAEIKFCKNNLSVLNKRLRRAKYRKDNF